MSEPPRFFREAYGGGVLVAVRLTPKAGRDAIDGPGLNARGLPVLLARVSAVLEAGHANAALVALLSKAVSLPKSRVSVIAGQTARSKILRLEGKAEPLLARLEARALSWA